MSKNRDNKNEVTNNLFERVITILEEAKRSVVQSVNSNMVIAYWLIGREIVEQIQNGEERAEYGTRLIDNLSKRLQDKYSSGFSIANLKRFRQFYQAYAGRQISSPPGSFLQIELAPRRGANLHDSSPPSATNLSSSKSEPEFNPNLSWSHYRALMCVNNLDGRRFYEYEAAECGWSKRQLERQIQTAYYERILKKQGRKGLLSARRERLPGDAWSPIHVLKSPYVLEFLDLPDSPTLHESDLEQAIINNLQSFLLELGKGFSFVARQKHICFDDDDFYVDLVFYNFILKCFVLIDLKIGKLNHKDVGQMDGYVRLFEDRFKVSGDNPTIGLILCSNKTEAVAKYSVLKESKQIFAAKYLQFLPTEEELQLEIQRERLLLEEQLGIEGSENSQGNSDE